jgi:hypothetical protein
MQIRDIPCPEKRAQVHELLRLNAEYQAANVCVTNSADRQREINDHCYREFIAPMKDICIGFFKSIST